MRPGLTTATHCSGAPLPLPMRVSCGFLVMGLSGKSRIQIRPLLLMKRELAVQVPLGARDLGAVEAAGDAHLDPLGPEAQRGVDRLAHGPAERDALLELERHRLADELGVQLRLQDLLDVDEDLLAGLLLDLLLQLVDLLPLAADDDAGAGRVDADLQLVGGALDLHARDAGVGEALLEVALQQHVLVEQVRVLLLRVPPAAPGLVEAQAEPRRMYLLPHQFDSRSATLTVRWVVRLITW